MRRELFLPAAGLCVREGGEGEPRRIEGYAIRFNEPSAPLGRSADGTVWREIITPEAVTRGLLDSSDILMTLFHERTRILARSKKGAGTLEYDIDGEGVRFRFTPPATADGEMALELVQRGELDGCSFIFSTRYDDSKCVEREITADNKGVKTGLARVKKIFGIYDFTLTPSPAYPSTSVAARDLTELTGCVDAGTDAGEAPERAPVTVRRNRLLIKNRVTRDET